MHFLISLLLVSNVVFIQDGIASEEPVQQSFDISIQNISSVGIHLVAAYLAEMGYFQGTVKQARLDNVESALKSFQLDIGVADTGILDDQTWKKLKKVKLSRTIKAELEAAMASEPVIEVSDPAMPTFTLKEGETVFALEKVECKSPDEAFVLFYKGRLQKLKNDKVQITATERYALWYDRNSEGVSKTDWWCIPRKRFCSSKVGFSDWDGKIKQGEVGDFQTKWTMPSRFDMTHLAANSAKQVCHFAQTERPLKQPPSAKQTSLPNEVVLLRIISKHHYLRPKLHDLRRAFDEIADVEHLNSFLKTLDPYSKYVPKEQNDYYKKRATKNQIGLGINIQVYNDKLVAVPIYKAPAYRAGFRSPSYLITLNKRKILPSDFSSFSFITQLSPRARIPLLVSGLEEKAKKYTVTIAKFKNPSIEYLKEGNISLIRIHKFDGHDHTAQKLKAFVLKAIKQGEQIIIDLRYCPGGSLFEAIDAVSLFMPPDIELSYTGKAGKKRLLPFVSLSGQIVKNRKIFVWVSPLTASAAEVFGNILQHYAKNTVIVGRTTKGKCLSQQVFEFQDGSALHLSVFEIFGPDKQSCEGIGITPDVEIPKTEILNSQYYFEKSTFGVF